MNKWSEKEFPEAESSPSVRHGDARNTPYGTHTQYKGVDTSEQYADKISLFQAIEEAVMQAEKLEQMVSDLTNRLVPIRRESAEIVAPNEFKMNIARARPNFGSPFAARVSNISDIIKTSQARISRTMDELDL